MNTHHQFLRDKIIITIYIELVGSGYLSFNIYTIFHQTVLYILYSAYLPNVCVFYISESCSSDVFFPVHKDINLLLRNRKKFHVYLLFFVCNLWNCINLGLQIKGDHAPFAWVYPKENMYIEDIPTTNPEIL